MITNDLNNLMELYSMRGIEDWNQKAGAKLKIAVRRDIPVSAIANNGKDVRKMICRIFSHKNSKEKFIPMPKCSDPNIDWCFFLPIKINQGNNEYLRLFLLVKCKRHNWLGFRFEGDRQDSRHGYSHLQFTRNIPEFQSIFGPDWLPLSYPAFPVPALDSSEMFLSMVTAVHGLRGGIDELLRDIFQQAARPKDAIAYTRKLNNMLNTNL